jgi:hypothetical protein
MPWFGHDPPDSTDLLVHFTGRSGNYLGLSDDVTELTPQERLESILESGAIWPRRPFLISPWPVVCFSEATDAFLNYVLGSRNYGPWGIVFHRDLIYERNGGPVVHYRPDQWDEALEGMSSALKSRFVRFTPGESKWLWEREWRVVFQPNGEGFEFEPDDVEAIIVGDEHWEPVVPGIGLDLNGDAEEVPVRPDWLPYCEVWWWNRRRRRLEVLE